MVLCKTSFSRNCSAVYLFNDYIYNFAKRLTQVVFNATDLEASYFAASETWKCHKSSQGCMLKYTVY